MIAKHQWASSFILLTSSIDRMFLAHPVVGLVGMWGIAMLSYHQDVKHPRYGFGPLSRMVAASSLIAIFILGFTRAEWWDFLIVSALAWLHFQLTRRWTTRPGAWW